MRNIPARSFARLNAIDALCMDDEPLCRVRPPRTLVLRHVPPNVAIDALLAFRDVGLGIPVVYPRTRK